MIRQEDSITLFRLFGLLFAGNLDALPVLLVKHPGESRQNGTTLAVGTVLEE